MTASQMKELHKKGKIGDSLLMLYAISGTLPDRNSYKKLTAVQKQKVWDTKISNCLGDNWRDLIKDPSLKLPIFDSRQDLPRINWLRAGF